MENIVDQKDQLNKNKASQSLKLKSSEIGR